MTTSKGTIQGYNGVAAVDKSIRSLSMQAFGEGQDHHTGSRAGTNQDRYQRLNLSPDIYRKVPSSRQIARALLMEANMKYLHENRDWQIHSGQPISCSRDPRFNEQKTNMKRPPVVSKRSRQMAASELVRILWSLLVAVLPIRYLPSMVRNGRCIETPRPTSQGAFTTMSQPCIEDRYVQ